jgi:hypothetical protein
MLAMQTQLQDKFPDFQRQSSLLLLSQVNTHSKGTWDAGGQKQFPDKSTSLLPSCKIVTLKTLDIRISELMEEQGRLGDLGSRVQCCTAQLWSRTRMEARGKEKHPGLGPGHLQPAGPLGEVENRHVPHPASLAASEPIPLPAEAPLDVFIHSLVTSISPRLLLLIKCPCGYSRQPDVILHSPALLPSVGHTAVIQASWVTERFPGGKCSRVSKPRFDGSFGCGCIKYSFHAPAGWPDL